MRAVCTNQVYGAACIHFSCR